MSTFMQLFLRSLETGSIYALAALGIIIVFRTSNITHFAQGALGTFNTFVVAILFTNYRFPLWAAILAGILSAFVMGLMVDYFIIRRAKKIAPIAKQIITLGMVLVIVGVTAISFGLDPFILPKLFPKGDVMIAGASISINGLFNIGFGLVLMGILFVILQKTKWGLAVRTTASNEFTARLMGVPTRNVTMIAWALAGVLGVLAGVMYAPLNRVDAGMLDYVQISALVACVLGGFQSFHGPIIGAYILAIAKNLMSFYWSDVWAEQLVLIAVLIFIIFRPNGIIGRKIVKKV
ncbi:MAG: Branched-chain amino acid ABC transporter permease protein [Erysipelotrichaceae bacterium]|nr:MAG: Branched-chain amino acid ABC transporter permease [Erysipelotrichaceae bacterium]TXT19173.1 MAG: Branched-chain amino acid ABC transporter permease protein [Erysipelotrichaceae bacterium]